MEIVLQWLDDLDDAVFAVVLAWERLRRRLLQVGAAAATALPACAATAADWVLPLAAVAGLGVIAALLGAALAVLGDGSAKRSRLSD